MIQYKAEVAASSYFTKWCYKSLELHLRIMLNNL